MMNKSEVEYCDFSFNPVTGCLYNCRYCYAMSQLRRFAGNVRLNKGSPQLQRIDASHYTLEKPYKGLNGQIIPAPVGALPTLHKYRLPLPAQKKKPANIFVCSMADLFGEWVPDEWIQLVFDACKAAPWHNYLFLTKNPQRYQELYESDCLPKLSNFWYGSTVTSPKANAFITDGYNTFVNIEPLLEPLDVGSFGGARWIIVGAETGKRAGKVKPERAWIENIIDAARITGAAVLLKDSEEMREVWGDEIIQEFPASLQHTETIIPHCKECEYCITKPDGKRGQQYFCTFDPVLQKHIVGRYTRTSPPWCKFRIADISVGQKWEPNHSAFPQDKIKRENTNNKCTKNQEKTRGAKPTRQSGNNKKLSGTPYLKAFLFYLFL